MLKLLLEKLFVKLKNEPENDRKNKTGNFDFFETHILKEPRFEKYNGTSVTSKTMKNYYDKHVLGKNNNSNEPSTELKNLISEYLGFEDYIDFIDKNQSENEANIVNIVVTEEKPSIESKKEAETDSFKTEEEPPILIDPPINPPPPTNWRKIMALSSIPLLGLLYIPYQNSITNASDCIIWTGNEYEKTACDTYKAIDNKNSRININTFKRIEVDENTTFFKEGNAIIWYGKNSKGVIEYFNARGVHPETGLELHKVTRYFLNKQGFLKE